MQKTNLFPFRFCFLLFALCSLLFLSGCATTPPLKEMQIILPGPTYTINDIQYKPLVSICQYYNLEWEWDPVSNEAILKGQNTTIKLAANSDIILINNRPEKIDAAVEFYDNNLVLPLTFATKTLDRTFKKPSLPKEEPRQPNFYTLKTVILDPGHGGYDPGAIGKRGTREKHICLDISKRIKHHLDSNGITVIMTRDTDRFVSLPKRVSIAERSKADLFVSIHANASRSSGLNGFEIYRLSENIDDNLRAARMAQEAVPYDCEKSNYYSLTPTLKAILWDLSNTEDRAQAAELSDYITDAVRKDLDIRNHRIKDARFYVLKLTNIPAILIETGYLSNFSEEADLRDPQYRERIARAIAKGILAYKERFDYTDGFTR